MLSENYIPSNREEDDGGYHSILIGKGRNYDTKDSILVNLYETRI